MDITSKLRLIQEGYSITDINTAQISESSSDEFTLIIESITIDMTYISEMSESLLQESGFGVSSDNARPDREHMFKKILDIIVQKIGQFKMMLMTLFRKKKQELTNTHLAKLKTLLNRSFTPFVIHDTFEDVIYNPKNAIKNLKTAMENFEDSLVRRFEIVYNGRTDEISKYNSIAELRKFTWQQTISNRSISYDHNVTKTVIDHVLHRVPMVEISSAYQINNIVEFAGEFYDLWRDVNNALSYYEVQLKKLRSLSDVSFRTIRLICETILHTLPEILRYVDSHLGRLVTLDNYLS